MSIATVVTRGYGSFGDIAHLVARGFDVGAAIFLKTPADRTVGASVQGRVIIPSAAARTIVGSVELKTVNSIAENRIGKNLNEKRTV